MLIFVILFISHIFHPISSHYLPIHARGICDFSQRLIKNCKAVIEDKLTLTDSVVLDNVILFLTCKDHSGCIQISKHTLVSIMNSDIKGLVNEDTQGPCIVTEGSLLLDSSSIKACSTAIEAKSTATLDVSNSIFEDCGDAAIILGSCQKVSITNSKFIRNQPNGYRHY